MEKLLEIWEWVLERRVNIAYVVAFMGFVLAITSFKNFGAFDEQRHYKDNYKLMSEIDKDKYALLKNEPIYIAGQVTAKEKLSDDLFFVDVPGLEIKRSVSTYQWKESIQDKEPSYEKVWAEEKIDSSKFVDKEKKNDFAYVQSKKDAEISIGGLKIDANSLIPDLENSRVQIQLKDSIGLSDFGISKISKTELYYGESREVPKIGDQIITFSSVPEQKVTIAAAIDRGEIKAYEKFGNKLMWVKMGTVSTSDMFAMINTKIYFNVVGSILAMILLMVSAYLYSEKLLWLIILYEEYTRITIDGVVERILKNEISLSLVVSFVVWSILSAISFFIF